MRDIIVEWWPVIVAWLFLAVCLAAALYLAKR
jgi:hypothetical protein